MSKVTPIAAHPRYQRQHVFTMPVESIHRFISSLPGVSVVQGVEGFAEIVYEEIEYDDDDFDFAVRVSTASVDLAEFGTVYIEDYALAKAVWEAHPGTYLEGRAGEWKVWRP